VVEPGTTCRGGGNKARLKEKLITCTRTKGKVMIFLKQNEASNIKTCFNPCYLDATYA
jgi:hypothetical protein